MRIGSRHLAVTLLSAAGLWARADETRTAAAASSTTGNAIADFSKTVPTPIDLGGTPSKGAPDAPLKIVVFSDFLCPHCRAVAHAIDKWLPTARGGAAVYYKNYPLDAGCHPTLNLHPGACWIAYGGVCAQEQGKFWEYHDRIFAGDTASAPRERAALVKIAGELGMKESVFDACIGSKATQDRIAAEVGQGTKAGITGTPAIFINGKRLPRPNLFFEAIDHESKGLGLGPMPAQ